MSLARQLRAGWASWRANYSRLLSTQAASAEGIPEFFATADLSQATSNIGLARRRDLTFRQDIRLSVDGQPKSLKEVFKGEKAIVFGVPDCGKVCSEEHVPGYAKATEQLRELGITKVICVAVGDTGNVQQWAAALKVDPAKVQVVADTNGSWTRYLGMELGAADAQSPRSLRYSAIVDDGVLLKLKVDADPAKVEQSSAASMVATLKAVPHWGA